MWLSISILTYKISHIQIPFACLRNKISSETLIVDTPGFEHHVKFITISPPYIFPLSTSFAIALNV